MEYYGSHIGRLIEALGTLPGIGKKSAQRMAFHIVNAPPEQAAELAGAIKEAREKVSFCRKCFTMTDGELCPICENNNRNHSQIMVVENSGDLAAYEKTGKFEGVYHVLGGLISPMKGIGPDDIRLKELILRINGTDNEKTEEVIIALNSSVEGETTAMYISKLVKTLEIPVKLTKIASGVPVGGDIENTDEITLGRAFTGRTEI